MHACVCACVCMHACVCVRVCVCMRMCEELVLRSGQRLGSFIHACSKPSLGVPALWLLCVIYLHPQQQQAIHLPDE